MPTVKLTCYVHQRKALVVVDESLQDALDCIADMLQTMGLPAITHPNYRFEWEFCPSGSIQPTQLTEPQLQQASQLQQGLKHELLVSTSQLPASTHPFHPTMCSCPACDPSQK